MGNKKGCLEGIWYEIIIQAAYSKSAEYCVGWNSVIYL